MPPSRPELKAELLADAERLIDDLLNWTDRTPTPDLTALEDALLPLRKQFGERLAERVLAAQTAVRPVPGPSCPTCQRELHYKGPKTVTVDTRLGPLQVTRSYYYCETCRAGLFPPR